MNSLWTSTGWMVVLFGGFLTCVLLLLLSWRFWSDAQKFLLELRGEGAPIGEEWLKGMEGRWRLIIFLAGGSALFWVSAWVMMGRPLQPVSVPPVENALAGVNTPATTSQVEDKEDIHLFYRGILDNVKRTHTQLLNELDRSQRKSRVAHEEMQEAKQDRDKLEETLEEKGEQENLLVQELSAEGERNQYFQELLNQLMEERTQILEEFQSLIQDYDALEAELQRSEAANQLLWPLMVSMEARLSLLLKNPIVDEFPDSIVTYLPNGTVDVKQWLAEVHSVLQALSISESDVIPEGQGNGIP